MVVDVDLCVAEHGLPAPEYLLEEVEGAVAVLWQEETLKEKVEICLERLTI